MGRKVYRDEANDMHPETADPEAYSDGASCTPHNGQPYAIHAFEVACRLAMWPYVN